MSVRWFLQLLVMHGMEKFKEENLMLLSLDQKNVVLNEFAARLVGPYTAMALILIAFAFLIKYSPLPNESFRC